MAEQPRERPIIFSAPMVRAILAGRKTMTRRILKPQPEPFRVRQDDPSFGLKAGDWCPVTLQQHEGDPWPRVTMGRVITSQEVGVAVGMRLWVRETWADVNTDSGPAFLYRADGNYHWCESDAYPVEYERYPGCVFATWGADLLRGDGHWRSPIHMFRYASRITLEVTGVKVERLQEISYEDCRDEGTTCPIHGDVSHVGCSGLRRGFKALWESIHGHDAWDANPWVVAISFRRLTPHDGARGG